MNEYESFPQSPRLAPSPALVRPRNLRKNCERNLHRLPLNNPNPVLRIGESGDLLFRNEAAQRLMGELAMEEPLALLDLLDDSWLKGEEYKTEERFLFDVDYAGGRSFRWNLVRDDSAEIIDCFGYEVSNLRRCESALVEAQKLEWIGQTAGHIAHDFNNYLGTLRLALETGMRHLPDSPEKSIATLQTANEALDRAVTLSRRLADFGKPGKARMQKVVFPDFLETRRKLFKTTLGSDIDLSINCAGPGIVVWADPHLLEQVYMNLLVNSRHAFEEARTERPRVDLRVVPTRTGGNLLEVEDNGPGMTGETLKHIFDPFYSTKPTGKGTGLGMYAVKTILDQFKGQISIRSAQNKGVRIRMSIPRPGLPRPNSTGDARE